MSWPAFNSLMAASLEVAWERVVLSWSVVVSWPTVRKEILDSRAVVLDESKEERFSTSPTRVLSWSVRAELEATDWLMDWMEDDNWNMKQVSRCPADGQPQFSLNMMLARKVALDW